MIDKFLTIAAISEGEFKDRGSKFIGFAAPILDESAFDDFLQSVKREHPKSRHHCFGWRLGVSGNQFRANDDGEPSGTAGRPILGQIDSAGLTDVGVVVVRYFGGTLLGTSGLINAYREAAAEALKSATKVEKFIEDSYKLSFSYEILSDVMNALKRTQISIAQQDFDEQPTLQIRFRKSETEDKLLHFFANFHKISLDFADSRLKNENCRNFDQPQFTFPSDTGGGLFFEKMD